ncbi:phage scaffolding protein [Paenibacillus vini]|uniref:phage scaffolding protein n=1 Tax=Paenibacillus vini TaxID=1476024 RepID=UPI0025B638FB|nr:phage scaffolding protein [Paenibacillus vini]MDN4069256.1 phage scaffolding protein [Paenibacillus vini]MDN4069309.1 phage scaffolding protein [Paenibacillus vini]
MEWLKKILEAQGLSGEQIKSITEGVENNYKGYVPEHRFEEVNTARKQAESDLKERDKQLEILSKSTGDNEALKEQIKKLQGDNKAAAEKYEADVQELKLNTALKLVLNGQAHDPDIVAGLLDKTQIKIGEDGSIIAGLDDQLTALRGSKGFLFAEKPESKGPTFKGAAPADGNKGGGEHIPPEAQTISNIFSQR